MKKLYIAYGSNMDEGQMAYRCPTARLLGQTEVEGYRLLFKGSLTGAYATIEPQEGGRVPVLIWEIGAADEASLDRYEGYPSFYYKKDLTVSLGGQEVTAMVYIMDERRRLGEPSGAYYGVLERAYKKFGFPMETLENAYMECRPDRVLPGGWRTGDTCFLLTHKKKGLTNQYTVRGYDGKYFQVFDRAQNPHRVSLKRMFRSRGEALASLQGDGAQRVGRGIRKAELEALRGKFPRGCRVELVKMDDPYREMPPGLKGVVTGVDDSGSIHVDWQNGSSLAVVYGEDYAVKIGDGEVTVGTLLRRCLPDGKAFHFMTPAGYVDLTAQDAEKILAGEMKPKGHPGDPEHAMEMEAHELLGFRCREADIREEQGAVCAFVY